VKQRFILTRVWDFLIIGSGFGGSVSALRLVEKGYRVLMLEKGGRLGPSDFPKTNWNVKRWLWAPAVGFRGLFKMTFFRHVTVLSGVGVGGGSLVYANTLPIPKSDFFRAESWRELADWERELSPHYQTARRMLGAVENPEVTAADEVMRAIAADIGRSDKFRTTTVAVYFGRPGETVPDPYFGGQGPDRTGCIGCGGCMLGCRFNAKNTLDKNYLYLAERRGLTIQADSEVVHVEPLAQGGYEVTSLEGASSRGRARKSYRALRVIFAGGVLGTVELLLRLKARPDGLPALSDRIGDYVRTNSEVLLGVITQRRDVDYSRGVAISSILHTDAHSHVEPVRYSAGSGAFRLLLAPHAPGRFALTRLLRAFWTALRHPVRTLRAFAVPDLARYSIILLFMRTLEGHLRFRLKRSMLALFRRKLATELGDGPAPTASIPEATEIGKRIADKIDGYTVSMLTETLLGIPTTAHILGGCPMGVSRESGAIDAQHRLFGYEGLYVVDGSAVSANPGVNPSLTICALAERAMSLIPARERAKLTLAATEVPAGMDEQGSALDQNPNGAGGRGTLP
jgi:cholesterol oxidase